MGRVEASGLTPPSVYSTKKGIADGFRWQCLFLEKNFAQYFLYFEKHRVYL